MTAMKCDRCGAYFDYPITEEVYSVRFGLTTERMSADLCPACRTSFETWLGRFSAETPAENEEEKHRMTCRKWMAEHYPSAVDEDYSGGVYGCPVEYKELKSAYEICGRDSSKPRNELCRNCWDQPVPEGVEG